MDFDKNNQPQNPRGGSGLNNSSSGQRRSPDDMSASRRAQASYPIGLPPWLQAEKISFWERFEI